MLQARVSIVVALCAVLLGPHGLDEAAAQGRGGAAGGPPPAAKAGAPQDLTGYWVSVVTEHWHLRMTVPPRGEFAMLPLNAEARRIANMWDPAKEAGGDNQCKAYGAAAIMRVPGRLNIRWADDNTLQIDTDSGTQTRMLRFGGAPGNQAPSWQGYSVASWETAARGRGANPANAHLKVVTTRMRPGYLRKNGVPYSQNATLEEHFDVFTEPNGDTWMVVTSIITDPQYLTGPYVTTNHFKKLPDNSGWDPTPCRADQPR
jgi:hypothetical protein